MNANKIIKKVVLHLKYLEKKVIRIADKYGWDVASEYKNHPHNQCIPKTVKDILFCEKEHVNVQTVKGSLLNNIS